jgi:SAM-dependent methyltransferase
MGERREVPRGVRDAYADHPGGADGWYREQGSIYANPHEPAVIAAVADAVASWPELFDGPILDLCCGSGEVTLALRSLEVAADHITGCDPFTGLAYAARCGSEALPFTFAAIADGALVGRTFTTVVCSYALHLCDASWLPRVCFALRETASNLVVITPHKRPELRPSFGWALVDEHRDVLHRTRLRRYAGA